MALEAQDNPFPYVTLTETADPSTPAANTQRLWLDTDGVLKVIDESDVVTPIISASGAVGTDAIWDAAGDLVQGTGANTAAKLGAGTAGQVLMSAGAAAANAWASRQLDYTEITSPVNVTATAEASGTTIITAAGVALDGSTQIEIEFFAPEMHGPTLATTFLLLFLFDDTGGGAASIGEICRVHIANSGSITSSLRVPATGKRILTPSAATHTYSVRGIVPSGTGVVNVGAGGSGALSPGFIRITRAL